MHSTASWSGIHGVGDLSWGAHFCQFYRTKQDLVESLVPYFQAGLANNEQCLWVTSEPLHAEEAQALLTEAVPDLAEYTRQGQIEIVNHSDWYTRCGAMSAEQVLAGWVERQQSALARGFNGLRLTGNTYWLERKDWRDFADYEAKVNATFRHHHIIGMCSYSLERCDSEAMLDVVRNHDFALVRRSGDWQIIENASLKIAKDELRKLNEQLEQRVADRTAALETALRVRDEFLSVASHELKTPIASLLLYVDGLARANQKSGLPPEEVSRRLVKAQEQCRRLEKLVTNLLDVSRATAGPLPLVLEPVDLAQLARSAAERFAEDFRRAGCRVELRAGAAARGLWDRMRLEQVITNLLSNAVKYASGKPVELSVTAESDRAVLSVKDHGIGIAPADRQRIFERFAQVSPGHHPGGFGLGLWIVRQIVEAHGGRIELESQPGVGSTFRVVLPRAAGLEQA